MECVAAALERRTAANAGLGAAKVDAHGQPVSSWLGSPSRAAAALAVPPASAPNRPSQECPKHTELERVTATYANDDQRRQRGGGGEARWSAAARGDSLETTRDAQSCVGGLCKSRTSVTWGTATAGHPEFLGDTEVGG